MTKLQTPKIEFRDSDIYKIKNKLKNVCFDSVMS